MPWRRSSAASDAVLAVSAGPKQPKQPRPTVGHRAPHPDRVTGPRHGADPVTSRHTVPLPLHSWHTECPGTDRRAPGQGGGEDLEELAPIDRAAVELVVDLDVGRDRGRGVERGEVLGVGVDGRGVGARGGEVAQSLDPPGGGARADGDEPPRVGPDLHDPLGVGRGGDGALHQGHVVGAGHGRSRHLGEVGDVRRPRPVPAARPRSRAG